MLKKTLIPIIAIALLFSVFTVHSAMAQSKMDMKTAMGTASKSMKGQFSSVECSGTAKSGAPKMCETYGCRLAFKTADGKTWEVVENEQSLNIMSNNEFPGMKSKAQMTPEGTMPHSNMTDKSAANASVKNEKITGQHNQPEGTKGPQAGTMKNYLVGKQVDISGHFDETNMSVHMMGFKVDGKNYVWSSNQWKPEETSEKKY